MAQNARVAGRKMRASVAAPDRSRPFRPDAKPRPGEHRTGRADLRRYRRAQEGRAQKAQEARNSLEPAKSRLRNWSARARSPASTLRQARADRDDEWSGLRAFLAAQPRAGRAFGRNSRLFETLAAEADRRADALLADSAHVAAADAEREKIAAARARSRGGRKPLAEATLTARSNEAAWAGAWQACGVTPLAPREMAAWRGSADSLLDAREALARKMPRRAEWDLRLAEARPHWRLWPANAACRRSKSRWRGAGAPDRGADRRTRQGARRGARGPRQTGRRAGPHRP